MQCYNGFKIPEYCPNNIPTTKPFHPQAIPSEKNNPGVKNRGVTCKRRTSQNIFKTQWKPSRLDSCEFLIKNNAKRTNPKLEICSKNSRAVVPWKPGKLIFFHKKIKISKNLDLIRSLEDWFHKISKIEISQKTSSSTFGLTSHTAIDVSNRLLLCSEKKKKKNLDRCFDTKMKFVRLH